MYCVCCAYLAVFDIVCLFHCILSYGIVYITFCSQWGPGGQGREKTVVTPGKMEDMQRGGLGRIWKEKKSQTEKRNSGHPRKENRKMEDSGHPGEDGGYAERRAMSDLEGEKTEKRNRK